MRNRLLRLLPLLAAIPALGLIGWTFLVTNFMGIPLDATIGTPSEGQGPVYSSAARKYVSGSSSSSTGGQAAASSSGVQKVGIPLYIYPDANWTTVDNVGTKVGFIVANDSNGDMVAPDANYVAAINAAHTAGLTVLGYVHTTYAARALATVEASIDNWYSFYGIDGIFIDETSSSAADLAYYTTLYAYIRAKTGADLVALNPGTTTAEGYAAISDIICTFEGTYASYVSYVPSTWTKKYNASKFWHLVYSTSLTNYPNALTLSRKYGAGWVDITDQPGYTALPTYLALEAQQAGYAAGDDVRIGQPPLTAGRIPYDTTTSVTWTATGGTTTQVLHGGSTPAYNPVVVADVSSGAATNGQVATANGAGAVTWVSAGSPVSVNTANSDGTATTMARSDHVHTVAAGVITDTMVNAANKDGAAGTPSMRTLSNTSTTACAGNDSRLSDSRAPSGSASGDLTGTYPGPTIAALAVTDAKVAAANKDGAAGTPSMRTLGTGASQAAAGNAAPNAHAASHLPGGSDALTTATGVSTGAANATGSAASFSRSDHTHAVTDLSISGQTTSDLLKFNGANWVRVALGSNSTVLQVSSGGVLQYGTVTSAMITDGTITDTDVAAANKDGAAGTASLRTLSNTSTTACAGNDSRLSDSRAPSGSASGDLAGSYPSPTVANLHFGSDARGDMATRGASVWGRVAIGTVGKIWQSDGTDPSWATPTGTGTPVLGTSPSITTPILSGTPASSGAFGFASNEFIGYNTAARKMLGDEFHPVVQVFTASSSTYTPTANTIFNIVECVGGGGGSGGIAANVSYILGNGGAGSGSYSRSVILSPSAVTVAVGAAGTAGSSGANAGGDGGNTTYNSTTVVANGGLHGAGQSTASFGVAGSGGAAGTGDIAIAGNPGSPGVNTNVAGFFLQSGNGGNSRLGAGGKAPSTNSGTSSAGTAGVGYGGGGSGSLANYSASNVAGAAGAAGVCIITDWVRR